MCEGEGVAWIKRISPRVSPPDDGQDDEHQGDDDDGVEYHNHRHCPGGDGAGHGRRLRWLVAVHSLQGRWGGGGGGGGVGRIAVNFEIICFYTVLLA